MRPHDLLGNVEMAQQMQFAPGSRRVAITYRGPVAPFMQSIAKTTAEPVPAKKVKIPKKPPSLKIPGPGSSENVWRKYRRRQKARLEWERRYGQLPGADERRTAEATRVMRAGGSAFAQWLRDRGYYV
jgi:hypothetical protein